MSSEDKLRVLALEKLVKSSLKNLSALFDKLLFNIYHMQDYVAGSMDETKEYMKCVSHSET